MSYYKGTSYYDMAMDAGYRGEEAEQMAAQIEEEHWRQAQQGADRQRPVDAPVSHQPIVMRLMVDVTFDPVIGNSAKSADRSEREWFESELLGDPELFLHSNLVGDTIGTVKVVNLRPANFTDVDVEVVEDEI